MWVCLCVCGSVTTITRNCMHDPHRTGFIGKGSDHLKLIKFWPSCVPGEGGLRRGENFLALPRYSQRAVFASLCLCLCLSVSLSLSLSLSERLFIYLCFCKFCCWTGTHRLRRWWLDSWRLCLPSCSAGFYTGSSTWRTLWYCARAACWPLPSQASSSVSRYLSLSHTNTSFERLFFQLDPGKLGVSKSVECDTCPSVLWHYWLGDRKGVWPVKVGWWFAGGGDFTGALYVL